MNQKYAEVIRPEEYWVKSMSLEVCPEEYKELVLMLLRKIDALNERIYDATVRAEDAYQEMVRLRQECQPYFETTKQLRDVDLAK